MIGLRPNPASRADIGVRTVVTRVGAPAVPAAVVVAAVIPLLLAPSHLDDLARIAATAAIFALGYVVILGLAGQFSLAHAALYGVGAYTAAILATRYHWEPLLALPAAAAAGGVAGAVLGLPALRVRGDQLAVLTLAVGVGAQMIFLNWTGVTGGYSGIADIPAPRVGGPPLVDDRSLYLLALALLGAVVIGVEALRRSRLGRAMRAVQADELQAQTLGIRVGLVKVLAFGISGAIVAIAGWLNAESVGYVSSAAFGVTYAVLGVVMVLLAGAGRIYAAILAAAALGVIDTLTQTVPQIELAVLGAAMLGAVLWRGRRAGSRELA